MLLISLLLCVGLLHRSSSHHITEYIHITKNPQLIPFRTLKTTKTDTILTCALATRMTWKSSGFAYTDDKKECKILDADVAKNVYVESGEMYVDDNINLSANITTRILSVTSPDVCAATPSGYCNITVLLCVNAHSSENADEGKCANFTADAGIAGGDPQNFAFTDALITGVIESGGLSGSQIVSIAVTATVDNVTTQGSGDYDYVTVMNSTHDAITDILDEFEVGAAYEDVTNNDLVYILNKEKKDTLRCFMAGDRKWTGSVVVVFEPSYYADFDGVPVLSFDHPLLPLVMDEGLMGNTTNKYVTHWADSRDMRPLYTPATDVTIIAPQLVIGCSSFMCDGQHTENMACPSIQGGGPPVLLMEGYISAEAAGITANNAVQFRSRTLTEIFLTPDAIQNTKDITPPRIFRRKVNAILNVLKDEGVKFSLSGWYKPGRTQTKSNDESVIKPARLHITRLNPNRHVETTNALRHDIDRGEEREQILLLDIGRNQNVQHPINVQHDDHEQHDDQNDHHDQHDDQNDHHDQHDDQNDHHDQHDDQNDHHDQHDHQNDHHDQHIDDQHDVDDYNDAPPFEL